MRPAESIPAEPVFEVLRSILIEQLTAADSAWNIRSEALSWSLQTRLDERGLGLDSIALLQLAAAVNRYFAVHETGLEDYLLARRSFGEWTELIQHTLSTSAKPYIEFTSSGSTGPARYHKHRLADLSSEAEEWVNLLPAADRILCYVPPHHIYGFIFSVLPALMQGVPVEYRYLHPLGFRAENRDRVVSFPAHWRRLAAEDLPSSEWHGISSTAPLESAVAARIRDGGHPLYEVYGSTESAGIGYRSAGGEPYRLLPCWRRDAADSNRLLPKNGNGRSAVGLPDRIEWEDDRRFRPAGRLDGKVQIAGVNVSPAEAAARLTGHPQVKECAVRPFETASGTRLKAFVVPASEDEDLEALRRELREWCGRKLSSAERPIRYSFGKSLPVNALGKASDWEE